MLKNSRQFSIRLYVRALVIMDYVIICQSSIGPSGSTKLRTRSSISVRG